MNLRNWNIGVRLGAASALLLALLAAVGGLGISAMADIEHRLDLIVRHDAAEVVHATTVAAGIRDIMLSMSIMVQSEDKAGREEQKSSIGAARQRYGAAKKALLEGSPDATTRDLLDRLDATLKPAVPVNNKLVELSDAGNRAEASELFVRQSVPSGRTLIAITDEIVAHAGRET